MIEDQVITIIPINIKLYLPTKNSYFKIWEILF